MLQSLYFLIKSKNNDEKDKSQVNITNESRDVQTENNKLLWDDALKHITIKWTKRQIFMQRHWTLYDRLSVFVPNFWSKANYVNICACFLLLQNTNEKKCGMFVKIEWSK